MTRSNMASTSSSLLPLSAYIGTSAHQYFLEAHPVSCHFSTDATVNIGSAASDLRQVIFSMKVGGLLERYLSKLVVHEQGDVLWRSGGEVDEVLKGCVEHILEALVIVECCDNDPAAHKRR